jgi:hypothetical protein
LKKSIVSASVGRQAFGQWRIKFRMCIFEINL